MIDYHNHLFSIYLSIVCIVNDQEEYSRNIWLMYSTVKKISTHWEGKEKNKVACFC